MSRLTFLLCATLVCRAEAPPGFTPIFNGRDLSGWHVSKTNHHGTTPEVKVVDGVIHIGQNPPGRGGVLLTDRKYRDLEVYVELMPEWGCDGGLFLRSNEDGAAYQVMIDYLERGSVGGIYGERLKGVAPMRPKEDWTKLWRKSEWNTLRARIEGETPHIMVWMNGTLLLDATDTANHAADGAVEGMIGLQSHYSNEKTPRWAPGGYHRFRVVAVKELNK